MKNSELKNQVAIVIDACESKKAENVSILEMQESSSSFTDYFIISSGSNPRQVQSIADEIELRLKREGTYPNSMEGYQRAEWILIDYVDFVVHVFHEPTRKFYDLERLWKSAKRLTVDELKATPRKKRAAMPAAAAKRAKTARSKASAAIGEAVRSATTRSKPAARKKAGKAAAKPAKRPRKKK
jgi:ribosome-associated protein